MHSLTRSVAFAFLIGATSVFASPEKAARFYEDALKRYQAQDFAGAVIQLKNALQQDGKLLTAQVLLGQALLKNGEPAGAEAAFIQALQLGVARTEVVIPLTKAYFGQGKYSDVIKNSSITGLVKSEQIELLALRGSAYSELGDNSAAEQAFAQGLALDPNTSLILIAQCDHQIRMRHLDKALAIAKQATVVDPKNADAWSAKGAALHGMRQTDAAIEAYSKAIQLDPKHIDARVARASIYLDLNRNDAAGKDLTALREFAIDDPRAAFLRATLAGRNKNAEEVQKSLSEVTNLVDALPPEVRARRPQILLMGGMAHYGLNHMQNAKGYLETLVRQQPFHIGANKLLASIYLAEKDPTRAINLLDTIQRSAPNDPQLLALLASGYMGLKNYSKATTLYQQALQLDRTNRPDLLASLGLSQVSQGDEIMGIQNLTKAFEGNPGDARTGSALATLLLQHGEGKKAVAVMEKVVAHEPRNIFAWNLLGVAKINLNDVAGARNAYQKAVELSPKFAAPRLNLARLESNEGKLAEAQTALQTVLRIDPNNSEAMFEMGRLEERNNRVPSAIKWIDKARLIDRKNTRAAVYLVDLYLRQQNVTQALEIARETVASQPQDLSALAALARAQINNKDPAAARNTVTTLTQLGRNSPSIQVEIARLQLQTNDSRQAQLSLQRALEIQPDFYPAMDLQAEMALQNRDYVEAERLGKALITKYPNRGQGYHILADIAGSRGHNADAINGHRTALSKEPNTENALRLARAYILVGEPAKAASFLTEWQQTHSSNEQLQSALAEAYMRAQNWAMARAIYEKILAQQQNRADLYNNLALINLKLNQLDKALSLAEQARQKSPNDSNVVDTYGWILFKQNQPARALQLLREARLRDPNNLSVRYHLAWILLKTGHTEEARMEANAVQKNSLAIEDKQGLQQLIKELGL